MWGPVWGLAIVACAPAICHADTLPTLATDGVYIGTRIDPGVALSAAWDLDVYLTRHRTVSVGPAVSISVLGTAVDGGRQQELMVAADVARLKIGPVVGDGRWRPFLSLGGGFTYTRLAAQVMDNVMVNVPGAMAPVVGSLRFPQLEEFAPLLSLGAGADWFTSGPIAISSQFVVHFHPWGTSRIPETWFEFQAGFRFGL